MASSGFGKVDDGGLQGFNFAFSKIFKETSESDKMIALSEGGKMLTVLVVVEAIKAEAIFTNKFRGNIRRL